ncbi:MAG: methionyl-tRNA formyltransferase [Helicobacteraceae bacterium]|jgi:methionyl-tRNA formyltransferase|nr:methionyl-tRNA formyltransferase [Helicobacteraceae bacterium]
MRIIFLGTPEYAAVILRGLTEFCEVALVVTQEDKPVGRKMVLTPPAVKNAALELGLRAAQPKRLDLIADLLANLKPDFLIVAAYGQILSERVLAIAPALNLHASLLPKYRGASPIQASLLNGDLESGLTLMRMDKGLDTGGIVGFAPITIGETRVAELTARLAELGAGLVKTAFENWAIAREIPQYGADSSLTRKVKKSSGLLNFQLSAEEIFRAFRAYFGWPNVYLEGGLQLNEIKVADLPILDRSADRNAVKIGEIIAIDKAEKSATIACSRGAIKIFTVTPAGKKEISAADYLNGKRLAIGDLFI